MTVKLEHLILGVLLEQPSNGYSLKRFFDTDGRFLRAKTQMSQVYRSLAHMEDRGLVSHSVEPKAGANDSKVYRVTDDGAKAFLSWLTSKYTPPNRFEEPELTVRLSFAGFMDVADVVRLIDTELHARLTQRKRFRNRDRQREQHPTVSFDASLGMLVNDWAHEHGSSAMDAHIKALEELRRALHPTE
ncbi:MULTISPECIES: PadR family transcriptional regulator [unclassified Pseudoclavibacter]|uniref:PadR family transcriptional regulator n=1 Tax=unclassified Pseudoclavibacter TaxID=2615177 RepID=UPI001C6392CA|nr:MULTISPECIES: PadR family transcriptional regulator [unclassified Pseudoclavibacter]